MVRTMVEQRAGIAVIAATFTAEPLLPTLRYLFREAGLGLAVKISPYNQVLQELISSSGELAANSRGAGIVLVRLEDFVRDIPAAEKARPMIYRMVDELEETLSAYVRRAKTPTIVIIFPPTPSAHPDLLPDLEIATLRLTEMARLQSGIVTLASEEIDRLSVGERYDDESNTLAHIPFTEEYYAALALIIARKLHALLIPARKVLVLDCDNTLWRGVVGEDGVDGIIVTPAFASLQRFAIRVQEQGGLICLASKNSEQDVFDVFETRTDMVLKLEHIVARRVNWDSKTQNLLALARLLNLGLDSFVFIDDNPLECELMRTELPQVATLLLPPEEQIEPFLENLWAFDKVSVTAEDLRRTSMYKEETARKEFETSAPSIADFMASLELKIDITSPEENEWARLGQLTQRTNQFNFTTVRRTEAELRALARSGTSVLSVKVRDRFGDYGLVGLVVFGSSANALLVDSLLLSCRALGRGVEHAIVRHLGSVASQKNLQEVWLPYIRTPKNEPARAFIESVAANFKLAEDVCDSYRIPLAAATAIAHQPGRDPDEIIKARDSASKKTKVETAADVDSSERYASIAQRLTGGSEVLKAITLANTRTRTLPGKAADPANDAERKMLALWEEILCVEGLGVEDDYAAIGGTSLLAVRLFAKVSQSFGIELPLTAILEFSTIRKLAGFVRSGRQQARSLIELKKGGSRNVFFVHDGDGETLLYLNVARRLPDEFSVFGIEPRRFPGVPLADTRIEDMAAHYNYLVREQQPRGPYVLGGMCAGGVIAYEMARQLIKQGERVQLVAILDAALPGSIRRKGRVAQQRIKRFGQLISNSSHIRGLQRWSLVWAMVGKFKNAVVWEVREGLRRRSVQIRFWLLRALLGQQRPWPKFIPSLSVRQIYDSAECEYKPSPVPLCRVLLLRAQHGEKGDTPFKEIFSDEALGWEHVAGDLAVADVNGGHFTMLQEPFAGLLADRIATKLNLDLPIVPDWERDKAEV